MDTRLNIFTKSEQVEFIPISLCHDQFIEYRHYCLSLARPNDMKIIIVQECHGLSWNLQTFYSTEEDKVKWALYQFNNYSYESHSTFSSWSSPRYNSNKRKTNSQKHTEIFLEFLVLSSKQIKGKIKTRKTIYTGKLPTSKRRTRKSFWIFFLVLLLSVHGK